MKLFVLFIVGTKRGYDGFSTNERTLAWISASAVMVSNENPNSRERSIASRIFVSSSIENHPLSISIIARGKLKKEGKREVREMSNENLVRVAFIISVLSLSISVVGFIIVCSR